MNSRYESKRNQFEADSQRLQEIIAEHDEITKELGYKDDAVERLRLERQQNVCRERMDKLARQCDRLKNELQVLKAEEEILQKLITILNAVRSETVIRVVHACLTQGRPRLLPDTVESLVRHLADIPGEPYEPTPILRFVSLLIQESSLTADQRRSLKEWAKTQGLDIQEEEPTNLKAPEICLMIKVQPRALNDPSLGYVVDAAIAQDPDPWNCDVETLTTPLSITVSPDPKCAPGYSQDDLPHVLDALIATCGIEHHIPLTELVIQWFLPNELMSLPVEHWQFQSGRHQKEYCGRRCKAVIIRSFDRHFLPHYQVASGDWQKYWKRLLNCHGSKCSEALMRLDPTTGKTKINWKNAKVVGCKFVEHHNSQQQEALWDELLGQGVPIALWIRQAGAQNKKSSLSACTIANLSEVLATHRQKALSHESETDRLKAASHCLLLDNPFRPFPTLDYESA